MSKTDPTAEGQVAPENEKKETPPQKEKDKPKDHETGEGQVAPENEKAKNKKTENEKTEITDDTGFVSVGGYTFPSKTLTAKTQQEWQEKKEQYIKECNDKVSSSEWILPTELTGNLLEGYFSGTISQEESEKLALEYIMQYSLYNGSGSNTEKQKAIRGSVIACEYSKRLTHLDIFEDHGVQNQGGSAVLTCADCKVGENLFSFGICLSPNATVQNSPFITIKDGENVVTGHMCMLKVATEWITGEKQHVHIWNGQTKKYEKCLPENAILTCTYGAGKIRIVEVPLVSEEKKIELTVPIIIQYLPSNYWHGNQTVELLVIHDTGNVSGDKAQGNYNYFNTNASALKAGVAAHAFLDDTKLLQTIPSDIKTYHTKGSYQGKAFNSNSYGFELCNLTNQEAVDEQFDNAAKYFAKLCAEFSLDPYDNIRSHHELTILGKVQGGHVDPDGYLSKWGHSVDEFRNLVDSYLN